MRLFVSINFSSQIQKYLEEIQRSIIVARMNPASGFHLTLKFLGEIPDEKVDDIKKKLGKIEFKDFDIELENAGYFNGPDGKVNVIWVGLKAPQELFDLQEDIANTLINYGEFEKRKFVPHLTLARIKLANNRDLIAQIDKMKIQKMGMKIERFSLMQSKLSQNGPAYSELAFFKALNP